MSEQQARWECESCGARHSTNEGPCRECAGEQFVKLGETETPHRVERTEDIIWQCKGCGETSPRNGTPCKNCGSFQYRRVDEDGLKQDDNLDDPETVDSPLVVRSIVAYGYAIFLLWFGGVAVNSSSFLAAAVFTGGGVLMMPVTRRHLAATFDVDIPTLLTATVGLIAFLAGSILTDTHI